MDASQIDALVERLVEDPNDETALAEAHAGGEDDPEGYGKLLERVGNATEEPAMASYWLVAAANVWGTTLEDTERAASALLAAVERDPGAEGAGEKLAEMCGTAQRRRLLPHRL